MSGPIPKDERQAVKEIKSDLDRLRVGSKRWEWSKAHAPDRPLLPEEFAPSAEIAFERLKFSGDLEKLGRDLTVVPGKPGERPLVVANHATELVLACGAPVGACVRPFGIVIPTKQAERELQDALRGQHGASVMAPAGLAETDVLKLFGLTNDRLKDPKVARIYKQSVLIHELEHGSEKLLDPARYDLYLKSEWAAYRAQADFLSAKLGTPKVSDGEILRFVGNSYGLGMSYMRSVLECFAGREKEMAPWLPGGAEFTKLFDTAKANLRAYIEDPRFADFRQQYEKQLVELETKPIGETSVGIELNLGARAHYQLRYFKEYLQANPGAKVTDEEVIRRSVQHSRSLAAKLLQGTEER